MFSTASSLLNYPPCFDICRQQGVPAICYPFGPIAEWSHQCCQRGDRPIKMGPSGSFITSGNRWLITLNQNWKCLLLTWRKAAKSSRLKSDFAQKSLSFSLSWQIGFLWVPKNCAESLKALLGALISMKTQVWLTRIVCKTTFQN